MDQLIDGSVDQWTGRSTGGNQPAWGRGLSVSPGKEFR